MSSTDQREPTAAGDRPSILIVDDDEVYRTRLARAFVDRGYDVHTAHDYDSAVALAQHDSPEFAVVDLKMPGKSGLELVKALGEIDPSTKSIVLTGYGSIANAIDAVRLGAAYYLSKPADADDVVRALLAQPGEAPPPPENPMSADRVRWEHIQRVFELCNHNVSETARRLNMHRRTLQRILAKRAPR